MANNPHALVPFLYMPLPGVRVKHWLKKHWFFLRAQVK